MVEEVMLHRSGIEMIDAREDPSQILNRYLKAITPACPSTANDPRKHHGVIHAKDDCCGACTRHINGADDDAPFQVFTKSPISR